MKNKLWQANVSRTELKIKASVFVPRNLWVSNKKPMLLRNLLKLRMKDIQQLTRLAKSDILKLLNVSSFQKITLSVARQKQIKFYYHW